MALQWLGVNRLKLVALYMWLVMLLMVILKSTYCNYHQFTTHSLKGTNLCSINSFSLQATEQLVQAPIEIRLPPSMDRSCCTTTIPPANAEISGAWSWMHLETITCRWTLHGTSQKTSALRSGKYGIFCASIKESNFSVLKMGDCRPARKYGNTQKLCLQMDIQIYFVFKNILNIITHLLRN